jgi:hypothetical protein
MAALVRMFPDWGTSWPLWSDDITGADPSDLGLSLGLVDDLRAWVEVWAEQFDVDAQQPSEYWRDAAVGRRWIADGHTLAARIRAEVPDLAVDPVFADSGPSS